MKYKDLLSIIVLTLAVTSCNQSKNVKAYVFERLHLPDSMLLIKYRFQAGHNMITDSAVIQNVPINNDSIEVQYNAKSPHKSFVDLKK